MRFWTLLILLNFFALRVCTQPLASADSVTWELLLKDVVVTAQYAPTDSKNAVHPIRTIRQETIQQRGANNLEELLNQELNVRIQQDLILGSALSLQGVSGQNVKIMIDGVPVIGRMGDNVDLSQINLHQIERVELVEGPLSVQYGTNALGGVINLISKKSQLKKFETGVTLQAESAGWKNWAANLGARLQPKILWQISGGQNNFEGLGTDSTRVMLWNPKAQKFAETSLRFNWAQDHSLRYTLNWFEEQVDDVGEVRRPQFKPYAFDDFYNTRRWSQSLQHEGICGKRWYVQSSLGYNFFERTKTSRRLDFETYENQLINGQQDTVAYSALTARSVFASRFLESRFNFQAGIDFNHETAQGTRIGESAGKNFVEMGDYALFGSLQFEPDKKLILQTGFRISRNTRYASPLVPSFNLKWKPAGAFTIRASYARGFRSPSLKELYFYFVDVNHFIVGNSALKAENANNFQTSVTFEKTLGQQSFDICLSGFYNDIFDKIDLYTFGEDNGKLQYAYFNRDHFKTTGLNLRAGYTFKNWNLKLGLAPTGRYNFLSESQTDVRPFTFSTESNGEISWSWPAKNLSVNCFVRHNDRLLRFYLDTADDGSEQVAERLEEGFTIADASISKFFWKKRIHLVGGVKNLFDVRNIGASGNDTAVGPHGGGSGEMPVSIGRSYFLRLGWKFGFGD